MSRLCTLVCYQGLPRGRCRGYLDVQAVRSSESQKISNSTVVTALARQDSHDPSPPTATENGRVVVAAASAVRTRMKI